jgi:hypothetical protein
MTDTQNPSNPSLPSDKRQPWNKGKLIGAKPPLRPKHVWSIRTRFQVEDRKRDLALFNLAINSFRQLLAQLDIEAVIPSVRPASP